MNKEKQWADSINISPHFFKSAYANHDLCVRLCSIFTKTPFCCTEYNIIATINNSNLEISKMAGVTTCNMIVSFMEYNQSIVNELNNRLQKLNVQVVGWGGGTKEFWYDVDYEGNAIQIEHGRTAARQYLQTVLSVDKYRVY